MATSSSKLLTVPTTTPSRRLSQTLLHVVPSMASLRCQAGVSKLGRVLSRKQSLAPNAQPTINFPFGNPEWLEASFKRRECVKIIPSTKDETRCCCGLSISSHQLPLLVSVPVDSSAKLETRTPSLFPMDVRPAAGEHWSPATHTVALPTDAYGCIDFRAGSQTNKAQFIRLSHDTRAELIASLLLREWTLEQPKLLISVHGGKVNFELQPKLKRSLRKGLLKAAKTTGAWIITNGTNTGVTKHVGDALVSEKSPRIKGGRVVSIGIAPWGLVDKRNELKGKKVDKAYHVVANPRSRFVSLNKHHAYFLLVDNGTVGKYGGEIALRRRLEKFLSTQQQVRASFATPLVALIIEGGTNTIRAVLEYVTDSPPVPVVVCDGTGRAADLIAFAHKYAGEDGDLGYLDEMQEELRLTIQRTFNVSAELAIKLHQELLQCVRRKNLITIFRCSGEKGDVELDQIIMTGLFKAQHLSPVEQLSLALTWNRCDVARKEIFIYGQEWPVGSLEQAMQEALENDRVDFVRLLLENGVNMSSFLTISRLEALYNTKKGPANTLDWLVRDVVPRMSKHYSYTLIDIGYVINLLMGSGFRSQYTRRKFRVKYELFHSSKNANVNEGGKRKILKKANTEIHFKIPSVHLKDTTVGVESHAVLDSSEAASKVLRESFDHPFSELIVWAVLTKRKAMAMLMWQHGEQAMSKALVASRLCQAMAAEAADDDLDVEIFDELTKFGEEFDELALNLLDFCYKIDDDLTQHLLTAALENWSRKTCLSLAVISNNLRFLAHPLSQAILADLWMGGLRMRKTPVFKIILGLLFPFSIAHLEFKTQEELELMPQTEEELQDRNDTKSDNSPSSSSSSSHRSSIAGIVGAHQDEDGASLELGRPRLDLKNVEEIEDMARSPSPTLKNNDLGVLQTDEDRMAFMNAVSGHLRKKTRPLKLKKKLYEFYAAPITKYYSQALAYAIFLAIYTYTCLVRAPLKPSMLEIYVLCCMIAFGLEQVRVFLHTEPAEFGHKVRVWFSDTKWHLFDTVAIITYLIAFTLRSLEPWLIPHAKATFATLVCYWYVRSLKLIGVNKYFGPYITMIGKMIENMIYFIVLLLVVLVAFGVCRQSILHPNEEPNWRLIRHIFFQPYFMLYGEVFAADIDPQCNPDCEEYGECGESKDGEQMVPCHTGRWITPLVMTVYLLVANILLINLLIASFNTIYNKVSAMSQQLFNFQRFAIVMEYEEKPVLPPPLTILSHVSLFLRYLYRQCKGYNVRYESGLKLFLSPFDMERLYDFEEEGRDSMICFKEEEKQHSMDVRLKAISDALEAISSKLQDHERWEGSVNESMQTHEFRLQHIEELARQTNNYVAVLNRMMNNNGNMGGVSHNEFGMDGPNPDMNIGAMEREDELFNEEVVGLLPAELRPDQEGVHAEGESIAEEVEELHVTEELNEEPRVDVETSTTTRLTTTTTTSSLPLASEESMAPSRPASRRRRPRLLVSRATASRRASTPAHSRGLRPSPRPRHHTESSSESLYRAEEPWKWPKTHPTINVTSPDDDEDGLQMREIGHHEVSFNTGYTRMLSVDTALLPPTSTTATPPRRSTSSGGEDVGGVAVVGRGRHSTSDLDMRRAGSPSMNVSHRQRHSHHQQHQRGRRRGSSLRHHRRQRLGPDKREYTSITDELEQLIPVVAAASDMPPNLMENSEPVVVPPAVQIETEKLNEAEVEHYQLMESVIQRRLRRDSTNLQVSLEDLAIRSIQGSDKDLVEDDNEHDDDNGHQQSLRDEALVMQVGMKSSREKILKKEEAIEMEETALKDKATAPLQDQVATQNEAQQ